MKNRIKITGDVEGTSYPFWIIVDPRQNFTVDSDGIYNIASMITGIWFSREAAEKYLKDRRHAYSKNAKVYCHSGYWSKDWIEALKNGNERGMK